MNLVVVLGLGVTAFAMLCIGQSLVLWWVRAPVVWPLRFAGATHPAVRLAKGILVPAAWLLIVVATPLCLGSTPTSYYGPMLAPRPWWPCALAAAYLIGGTILFHTTGYAAGYIRPHCELTPSQLRGKLLHRIFVVPIFAALIEELVFRGVLLEQLLVAAPPTTTGTLAALAISSVVFSAVHFVAPRPPGEPAWQAATGLFLAGCAIGAGYIHGGRTLWLPLAIHATGIATVEVPRLLTRFERRGLWLVGTREFPHSGLFGIVVLAGLTAFLLVP